MTDFLGIALFVRVPLLNACCTSPTRTRSSLALCHTCNSLLSGGFYSSQGHQTGAGQPWEGPRSTVQLTSPVPYFELLGLEDGPAVKGKSKANSRVGFKVGRNPQLLVLLPASVGV